MPSETQVANAIRSEAVKLAERLDGETVLCVNTLKTVLFSIASQLATSRQSRTLYATEAHLDAFYDTWPQDTIFADTGARIRPGNYGAQKGVWMTVEAFVPDEPTEPETGPQDELQTLREALRVALVAIERTEDELPGTGGILHESERREIRAALRETV